MSLNTPVLTPSRDLTDHFGVPGQELDLTDTANPGLGTAIRVVHDPRKGLVIKLKYTETSEGSTGRVRPI